MTESISIKNLGPVKDITIEHIKPFTVLIGESGSGKSTLMKALALFRWIYKMQNIRSYLKRSNISKSPFRFRMEKLLKNCGFEQFVNANTEIVYKTRMPSGNEYRIGLVEGKLTGTGTSDLIEEEDIYFNKISFISETRNIIPIWADKGAALKGDLGFYFQEVYDDFNLASDNLKEILLPYLNVKFTVKRNKAGKKYSIESLDNEFNIDFVNSSSGTQNAAPLSLIAQYFSQKFDFEFAFNRSVLSYLSTSESLTSFKAIKNLPELEKRIFIHIEEPELSLYPDAQNELINDIVSKCIVNSENNIELFFSTHSPYIINHLNLLIKAYDTNNDINGAKLCYDDMVVYQIINGRIMNLMAKNERLVNTNPLSDTINTTYNHYKALS